ARVTDSFSHTLLFSVLKTDQILQENVTSIENIKHKRAPQPSFEAAYITHRALCQHLATRKRGLLTPSLPLLHSTRGHPPPHQQYQGQGHGAPPHQAGYAGYNGGYGDGYGGGGYQQQQAPPPPLQPAPPPVNQRTYDRRFGGGVAAPVPVRDSEPALDSRWSAGPPGQGQGLGQGHAQPQQHNQQQQQHAYESHRP
ncbi:unnamed protein product, partial [Tilletia controversa]